MKENSDCREAAASIAGVGLSEYLASNDEETKPKKKIQIRSV